MIQAILKSLLIIGTVSGTIAFFLTNFEIEFWKSFGLIVVIQIAGWNIFKYTYSNRVMLKQRELDNKMMEELAKQSIVIPCAYCDKDNLAPVRFDIVNEFECEHCNKKNAIYINLESAQITTPVTINDTLSVNEQG